MADAKDGYDVSPDDVKIADIGAELPDREETETQDALDRSLAVQGEPTDEEE